MKNKFVIYLPILFAIILVAGIFLGYKLSPVISGSPNLFHLNMNRYDKLNDIINYVTNEYVDSVSRKELTEDGINGILSNLDPHSQYIPAEDFQDVNDQLQGNFEGIGIQFRIEKDTIIVIQTIPGGPSEKAGLWAGDRIVKVNDSLIAGVKITNKDAMKKLKGKKGTTVNVSIYRLGVDGLLAFTITRDVIPTYSVDIAFMPADSIGYIKLSKFSATTFDEFDKAVKHLKDQGLRDIILDLRGNAGGYLQEAIDISDEFLKDGKLIVYTEGKHQPKESFYATNKGMLENNKVIILIDEGTASASEIVSGAIQDNDRGLIVGRRSFGKGLVQRQLDFPDGSALRLTIARYYTPTGRCIQKPYDRKNGFEDYYTESYHRYLDGEMENKDSTVVNDSLKYVTPEGKVVYGGGGIMPDVFVPIDKDARLKYFNSIIQSSLIFRFAFEYTDRNRNALHQYKDFENFDKQFDISAVMFNDFIGFAEKNGIKKDSEGITYSGDKIKTMLKAYIGRNLFDDAGFYPIYLSIDKTFNTALGLLTNPNS